MSNTKLTLQHIAPFYANDLAIIDNRRIIHVLSKAWQDNDTLHINCKDGFGAFSNVNYPEEFKVILRRLDLTKPITIGGKEVIPAIAIAKIVAGIHNDDMDDNFVCKDDGRVVIRTPWDLKIEIFYKTETICFSVYDTWNYCEKRTSNQQKAFQWLYENKFNIDIPDELVVYVDTLETDIYNT